MTNENKTILIPLDGSVKVECTQGNSIAVDDVVIFGEYHFIARHPECNPEGFCIAIEKDS